MSVATEKLTIVEDRVIETVTKLQEPVAGAVRKFVEQVEGQVSNLNLTIPSTDVVPTAREIVENQYEFAGRLLKANHELVLAILDAIQPAPAKPVKATAKKAAAKPASEAA